MSIFVYLLIFEKIVYASGAARNMIPKWAWVSWMFVIVAAILVSIQHTVGFDSFESMDRLV
jgi:Mn2+/Fe2+ NRAMP family transporter